MERYRTRLIVGALLMTLGFAAEAIMLSGLVVDERPPAWFWAMLLWIGVGALVIVSTVVSAARERRARTQALFAQSQSEAPRG